jgi:hypothetical protein
MNPFDLPSVNLRQCAHLPNAPGLYFVICKSPKKLIYIGMSKSLYQRWSKHHRKKDFQLIDKVIPLEIAYCFVPADRLQELELRLIARYRPVFNIHNMAVATETPSRPRKTYLAEWQRQQEFESLTTEDNDAVDEAIAAHPQGSPVRDFLVWLKRQKTDGKSSLSWEHIRTSRWNSAHGKSRSVILPCIQKAIALGLLSEIADQRYAITDWS